LHPCGACCSGNHKYFDFDEDVDEIDASDPTASELGEGEYDY
jgi:hypothetical protein